ncbi:MAG: CBS domain-containing protein [Acidobacteriia bacterium]|nr:CBS domain-containing protein [Terriglobia bacterium]
MTRQVATCRPESNLAEAIALMWENDCGVLPVLGDRGEILGMITDRDIGVALGTRNVRSSDVLVRDVARDHVLLCRPHDDIHVALQTMRDGKVRRLPVMGDRGGLEGILSMDDVVLNAEADPRMGASISYGDVVSTLREIYSGGELFETRRSAA